MTLRALARVISSVGVGVAFAVAAGCSDAPIDNVPDADADITPEASTDDAPPTCATGLTLCEGKCVDVTKAVDDCGGCNKVCPSQASNETRTCKAGVCSAACPGSTRLCASHQKCEVESETSCGASCTTCPAPGSGHGSATCDAHVCGIQCDTGYGPCTGGCCPTHVIDIAIGSDHACTLDVLGQVKCWGDDLNGQTGDNATFFMNGFVHITAAPFLVPITAPATMIAASDDRSCAVLTNGTMVCWGYSGDGGLGDPNAFNTAIPVTVKNVTSPTAIATGKTHTCAIVSGSVKCWGTNDHGQIGNNGSTTTKYYTAVDVVGITNAVALSAGYSHTCAVTSAGTVKCWGSFGALGNPSVTKDALVPVDVSGISDAVSISGTYEHTCVVTTSGAIKCWGLNSDGQLGSGSLTPTISTSVVTVANLGGTATRVRAGESDTCAILSDQTMRCWGANNGAAGDGTKLLRLSPTSNGLTSLASLMTAWNVTCEVATDGTTRCQGVGNDVTRSTTTVLTPTIVTGLP